MFRIFIYSIQASFRIGSNIGSYTKEYAVDGKQISYILLASNNIKSESRKPLDLVMMSDLTLFYSQTDVYCDTMTFNNQLEGKNRFFSYIFFSPFRHRTDLLIVTIIIIIIIIIVIIFTLCTDSTIRPTFRCFIYDSTILFVDVPSTFRYFD